MATFALVHGAYHSGACFAALTGGLRDAGHDVHAPDLPVTDPRAGLAEYARAVLTALGDADDVIVVVHDLAGLLAPVLAAARPVRHTIYLAAFVTPAGVRYEEYAAAHPEILGHYRRQTSAHAVRDGSTTAPVSHALEMWYHDAPSAAARRAAAGLRPQYWLSVRQSVPHAHPSPATSIVCREDRAVNPAWSERVAGEMLGADVQWIDGGHAPFLSRPHELATLLDALVR